MRELLDALDEGEDLDLDGVTALLQARGADLAALVARADALRAAQVGDTVTYVVNRNINFTNVCVKSCRFCAFARGFRSEEGYRLTRAQVAERAREAAALGATEVCLQAGLAPELDGAAYVRLCEAVHAAAPGLSIHGFSPEELLYGARRSGWTVRALVEELMAVGLSSIPGTSAEVLVDEVRRKLAPGRLSTAEWCDVLRTVHGLGLTSSATLMYGHIETARHRAEHLLVLRELQRETGGFTELVPLSFVWSEAPLWRHVLVPGVRAGPSRDETTALFATSRLVLGAHIPHLQVSWVKEGLARAGELLRCGADDLGGTLMNESISVAAGAAHGQLATPRELRAVARALGRPSAERSTDYRVLRRFEAEVGSEEHGHGELDSVRDADARFGSYAGLVAAARG